MDIATMDSASLVYLGTTVFFCVFVVPMLIMVAYDMAVLEPRRYRKVRDAVLETLKSKGSLPRRSPVIRLLAPNQYENAGWPVSSLLAYLVDTGQIENTGNNIVFLRKMMKEGLIRLSPDAHQPEVVSLA